MPSKYPLTFETYLKILDVDHAEFSETMHPKHILQWKNLKESCTMYHLPLVFRIS